MITIPQRHRQTDRQTTCLGNTALRVASRGKKTRCLIQIFGDQFDDISRLQKLDGKSTLFRPTLKVTHNLPSLPYRFRPLSHLLLHGTGFRLQPICVTLSDL